MLLKKTSSSWSLSKSAAMTVRTGDGMENLGLAMSCARDAHEVTKGTGSKTLGPASVLWARNWSSKPNQGEAALPSSQGRSAGGPSRSPHPESDAPTGAALQVEAVRPIPVAVDDVHAAIAVKVSQCHTTSMLVRVIQSWGATRGRGGRQDLLPASRDVSHGPQMGPPHAGLHPCTDGFPGAPQSASVVSWAWGYQGSPSILYLPSSRRQGQAEPLALSSLMPVCCHQLPLLTHGSCHVPVCPIPRVVEEEIGAVLVTTEYVRGAIAQDGAHGHSTAPWGQEPGVKEQLVPCPREVMPSMSPQCCPPSAPGTHGDPSSATSPAFNLSHQELIGPGSRLS